MDDADGCAALSRTVKRRVDVKGASSGCAARVGAHKGRPVPRSETRYAVPRRIGDCDRRLRARARWASQMAVVRRRTGCRAKAMA